MGVELADAAALSRSLPFLPDTPMRARSTCPLEYLADAALSLSLFLTHACARVRSLSLTLAFSLFCNSAPPTPAACSGCKINGCQTEQPAGWVDPIWAPNQCAKTSRGWAQPHAYHVLNRYFTNYFPAAARLGDAARAGNQSAYVWMTQSWGKRNGILLSAHLIRTRGGDHGRTARHAARR